MSNMIPRESIDVFRNFNDIALDNFGFDVDLYVPTNLKDVESADIYREPEDFEYSHYTAKIFIHWNPSVYRLKQLGVYVENELAIFVRLPNQCLNDDSVEVDVDILKSSYVKVALEYIPGNLQKYTEFELVDQLIKKAHDAVIIKAWKAVPRRYINPENQETI